MKTMSMESQPRQTVFAAVSGRLKTSIKGVLAVSLLVASQSLLADLPQKMVGIDRMNVKYTVPENINEMQTPELVAMLDTHKTDLQELRKKAKPRDVARAHMLEQILIHDDVRLEIADVIPEMIEEYQIEGGFKDKLLRYQQTFNEEIRPSRKMVVQLEDYKAYDFRFSAAYMSLLFAFMEHPDFYERMQKDLDNPQSAIGAYRQRLLDSQTPVKAAQTEMDAMYSLAELEGVVDALNKELASRQ